jgi:2-methylaconitate cis-trans-isomerase PrpF
MRGGTSKGPVFLAEDLPSDPTLRDRVLLAALGSPHPLQVDGVGGGNPLTSKVAIVGKPTVPGADVDYLFAQVTVEKSLVDTKPNCGNMLAAVGPFAIERGLVRPRSPETRVRIHNVNTGVVAEALILTPHGRVAYAGGTCIDGVPGSGAPILLSFLDAAGSVTGALLPTGKARETIDGIDVTLADYAAAVMMVSASDLGLKGGEPPADIDAKKPLLARLEALRREAGRRMGLGDVSSSVLPKIAVLAPPRARGHVSVRYLTPFSCHKSLAVTGAMCVAVACGLEGSVAAGVARLNGSEIAVEHPSGQLEVSLSVAANGSTTASVVRTARLLFEGSLAIPSSIWPDTSQYLNEPLLTAAE